MPAGSNWGGQTIFDHKFVRFDGRTGDNRLHSHIAVQVVIGDECVVELASGERLVGPAIAIRPHIRHRLLPMADVRVYLIEPSSDFGAAVLATLPAAPVAVLDDAQVWLDRLSEACAVQALDPRLLAAMALLQQGDGFVTGLGQIAAAVELSPARLRALAARELGMPLGRWRRWAAIRRASMAMIDGASPAEAAAVAGFADQPHFSRTTRAMLGLTPAGLAGILRIRASVPFKTSEPLLS